MIYLFSHPMKKNAKIFLSLISIIVLSALLVSCSPTAVLNSSLSSGHFVAKLNIPYGNASLQKLDVYTPTTTISPTQGRDKPVLVFVYGGAWKSGDKKDFKFVAHAFTQAGYRVVIPNYRLFPAVKFPAFVNDVADAIAYMEQNANTLVGGLSQGMILMGHSAGAHTAALLTTDRSYFQRRNITTPLKALVALAGPYDLIMDHPEVVPVFQPIADERIAKPVRLVYQGMPPVLLLHGLNDKRVKPFHTQNFVQALQQAGVPYEVKFYKGVSHVPIVSSIASPLRFLSPSYPDTLRFLAKIR